MATSAEPKTAPAEHDFQAPRYLPLETVSVRLHGPAVSAFEPVFGILANISETGCCVITNLPVEIGVPLVARLATPRWPEEIELDCVATWCAERMEPVKEIVGVLTGLKFEAGASGAAPLLESGIFQLVP